MKYSIGYRVGQVIITVLLLLLCFSVIYPFLYMLAISLNTGSDAAKGGVYLWPREFTFYNFQIVLGNEVIRHAYWITIATDNCRYDRRPTRYVAHCVSACPIEACRFVSCCSVMC